MSKWVTTQRKGEEKDIRKKKNKLTSNIRKKLNKRYGDLIEEVKIHYEED